MLWKHVDHRLTAYLHGELSQTDSERVTTHLTRCERCREALDQIKLASRAVQALPRCSAPDALWHRIEAEIAAPATSASELTRRTPILFGLASAAAIVILAMVVVRPYLNRPERPIGPPRFPGQVAVSPPPAVKPALWQVVTLKGAPKVANQAIRGKGQIRTGQWLETDSDSLAQMKIADIGKATIKENSRVSLVNSAPDEHRIRLERGELHAKVNAPPRLFLVDTPYARAVDLGCEYTLRAEPDGSTLLRVLSGRVAMEIAGKASYVPMGMTCVTRPGIPPGTPHRESAHPLFKGALRRYDFQGGAGAEIAVILKHAVKRDALTLWHLLQSAPHADKQAIYNALNRFVKAPPKSTFPRVTAGDTEALNDWRDRIEETMFPVNGFTFTDFAVNVMKMQQKGTRK